MVKTRENINEKYGGPINVKASNLVCKIKRKKKAISVQDIKTYQNRSLFNILEITIFLPTQCEIKNCTSITDMAILTKLYSIIYTDLQLFKTLF